MAELEQLAGAALEVPPADPPELLLPHAATAAAAATTAAARIPARIPTYPSSRRDIGDSLLAMITAGPGPWRGGRAPGPLGRPPRACSHGAADVDRGAAQGDLGVEEVRDVHRDPH